MAPSDDSQFDIDAFRQYADMQRMQQQPIPQGILGGFASWAGSATSGTGGQERQVQVPYQTYVASSTTNPFAPAAKKITFNRINKIVTMYEGDKVSEPLDVLRIKVAKWLSN